MKKDRNEMSKISEATLIYYLNLYGKCDFSSHVIPLRIKNINKGTNKLTKKEWGHYECRSGCDEKFWLEEDDIILNKEQADILEKKLVKINQKFQKKLEDCRKKLKKEYKKEIGEIKKDWIR
jgi:hypothetical protein